MRGYLASDWSRLRRLLGTRAGGVYGAGFALLVGYLLLSVPLGPARLGSASLVSTLLWVALPVACLLVVVGGWFVRRNWLAWSIKRNLLLELVVLAPVVLWWTVVGRPETFSFADNPLVTLLTMTFFGLVVTLLLSAVVLAVRVVFGFVRGHPDDEDAPAAASTDSTPDTTTEVSTQAETDPSPAPDTDAPTDTATPDDESA